MIYTLGGLIGSKDCQTQAIIADDNFIYKKVWVRAVPCPWYPGLFDRISDAWAVFKQRAVAVRYPQPGELEKALER